LAQAQATFHSDLSECYIMDASPHKCLLAALALLSAAHGAQLTAAPGADESSLMRREAALMDKQKVNVDTAGHVIMADWLKSKVTSETHASSESAPAASTVSYFAMDGCPSVVTPGTCPHMETITENPANTAGVVCCNANGEGVKMEPVGNSSTTATIGCFGGNSTNHQPGASYAEALVICKSPNRLCTFPEVFAGAACGGGCTMDCTRIWTSTAGPCALTADSYEQGGNCPLDTSMITAEDCCTDAGIAKGQTWTTGPAPTPAPAMTTPPLYGARTGDYAAAPAATA